MLKTSLRLTLFLGLWLASAPLIGSVDSSPSAPDVKPNPTSGNLAFSVSDHSESLAFLSSGKEDISPQYNQHKIKLLFPHAFQGIKLNYRFIHFLYQSVLAHSYILGRTTALRAPPVSFLS